jgi:PhnB protein
MPEPHTSIIPNLSVRNGKAAVDFYKEAFGAVEQFRFESPEGTIFAALTINGARVFVADESPAHGNLSPAALGGTSVRIDLLVTDPDSVQAQALAAGATEISPVRDEEVGPRMGVVRDPFGHTWLIGAPWDPA